MNHLSFMLERVCKGRDNIENLKKKVMKDDRAKMISKAMPQPLKKLAKAKSRKAMKMLML